MYNQVYKLLEQTDLVLVLSWGDMRVVEQLMCIRYHFSSLLGIVSSLFVVSVSKSKCVFTFMYTIRFTSCLSQPI